MLHTQTTEGLHRLRLGAMAQALEQQRSSVEHQALSFEDRLAMLVERELNERENRRLTRLLKLAKLRNNAVIEDVDFRSPRSLDRSQILGLAESTWVLHHHNVAIVGPTGVRQDLPGLRARALGHPPRLLGTLSTCTSHARRTHHRPGRRATRQDDGGVGPR